MSKKRWITDITDNLRKIGETSEFSLNVSHEIYVRLSHQIKNHIYAIEGLVNDGVILGAIVDSMYSYVIYFENAEDKTKFMMKYL